MRQILTRHVFIRKHFNIRLVLISQQDILLRSGCLELFVKLFEVLLVASIDNANNLQSTSTLYVNPILFYMIDIIYLHFTTSLLCATLHYVVQLIEMVDHNQQMPTFPPDIQSHFPSTPFPISLPLSHPPDHSQIH